MAGIREKLGDSSKRAISMHPAAAGASSSQTASKKSRFKGTGLLAAAFALSLALGGCATPDQTQSQASGELQVMVAFYPLYYLAEAVVGDLGEVTNLTQSGAEPHDLELSMAQVQEMSQADFVLYLGGGFQSSVEEAVATTGVNALDAVSVVPADELVDGDSHIWLNPTYMADLASQVGDQLAQLYPEYADTLQANATTLQAQFEQLDSEYAVVLSDYQGATMVVTHGAFTYLAQAYGLIQLSIRGVNPEEEPSTAHLLSVAEQAQEASATTLFYDPAEDESVAADYAEIMSLDLAPLNTLEVQPDEGDYLSAMRENLDSLRENL